MPYQQETRVPPVRGSAAPMSTLPPLHPVASSLQPARGGGSDAAMEGDSAALVVYDGEARAALASRSTTVAARRGSAGPSPADLDGFRRSKLDRAIGLVPKKAQTPPPPAQSVANDDLLRGGAAQATTLALVPASWDSVGAASAMDPATGSAARAAAERALNRTNFGKREKRKVHPLQEDRTKLDVWPANATNKSSSSTPAPANDALTVGGESPAGAVNPVVAVLTRPQILDDLYRYITDELTGLRSAYADVDDVKRLRVTVPTESELGCQSHEDLFEAALLSAARATRGHGAKAKQQTVQRLMQVIKRGTPSASPADAGDDRIGAPCSREDAYHINRARVFGQSVLEFSRQFTAYRPFLLWVVQEFEDFAAYCHRHVWSPEARQQFKEQTARDVEANFAQQRADLHAKLIGLQNELSESRETLAKLEASQSTVRFQIDERDRIIAARDKEIAENAEGRAGLLNRITRLEKELWQQRLMLEEPERRIQELVRQNKDQEDRLAKATIVFEDFNREKTILKDRIERLEENVREQKKRAQGNGMNAAVKAEILSHKKRELELLEINAKLQARAERVELRMSDMSEALLVSRGDRPLTPRPAWAEFADVASSTAPNTMKKVQDLVGAHRQLLAAKDAHERELNRVKVLLGSTYRDDAAIFGANLNLSNQSTLQSIYLVGEDIMPSMRARWFPKMGLDTHVPGYLKGVGKVENLFLGRDAVQALVRHLWLDRSGVKPGTPWDLFMSKYLADHCPPNTRLDSFAYSLHHSMGWFAYDPFIGFTRNLVLGLVDETVFLDMQLGVASLRGELANAHLRGRSPPHGGTAASAAPPAAELSKTLVASTLIEVCNDKDDDLVKALVVAVSRDCPGRTVDLDIVFNYDAARGRFSHFLEEYYRQYLEQRRRLIAAQVDAIYAADTDEEGHLSPPAVAQALLAVDPNMPAPFLDDTIARLFSVTLEQLFPTVDRFSGRVTVGLDGERVYGCQDTVNSDIGDILQKLQQGVVRRFTPPAANGTVQGPPSPANGTAIARGENDERAADDDDDDDASMEGILM